VNGGLGGSLDAYGLSSDVTGIVSGGIKLDSGAFIHAGHDVKFTFKNADSTLTLSNGGYVLAGVPVTIHLVFDKRTSGGVISDGSPGSGLFVVSNGNIVPATAGPGGGLDLGYAPVTTTTVDPCVLNPAQCKPADEKPPTPDTPKTDPNKPLVDPGKTTGGDEGTFGSDSGDKPKDEVAGGGKKDEKDEKDKKDKKSDEAKDEKKDEKPAQKKIAQCT